MRKKIVNAAVVCSLIALSSISSAELKRDFAEINNKCNMLNNKLNEIQEVYEKDKANFASFDQKLNEIIDQTNETKASIQDLKQLN